MGIRHIVTAALVGGMAAVTWGSPGLAAQAAPATPTHQHPAPQAAAPPADMAAKCQAMMADQEKMMAELKAADARLDDLVGKMNAAVAAEKAAATAAVVNEMVTQRRSMRDGMMKRQHAMMAHMMGHMNAGKDSMAMCPMMKQMGGMKH